MIPEKQKNLTMIFRIRYTHNNTIIITINLKPENIIINNTVEVL